MNDRRPYDPERDGPLLSAYADGELGAEDRDLVDFWLANDERAQEELERVVRMKTFTDYLQLRPAPSESWEDFHRKVYNRRERGLGWILFWSGASLVGLYVVVRMVIVLLALAIPVLVRFGMLVAGIGLLTLFISALRERFFARARDRYDDVER